MAVEGNLREYYLSDILAAKHYPQVLRVTQPYTVGGRDYLKKDQYITILQRRHIELITGIDAEGRPFKVRNDRSATVEVVEQDRIVHNLAEVARLSEGIIGIEVCKELRVDKATFQVEDRLIIEKVGKSFRGRRKNINLRRERDDKSHRLSLDVIGSFKLIFRKTHLPIARLASLRTLPLSVHFRNTPTTSSNFPSAIVTVTGMTECDIVYILTVQEETYTYEAFTLESNIFVEKCNLTIPNSILKHVPNGIYLNSSDLPSHNLAQYKNKLSDIDAKLIEDIYAPGYYGSATYEKKRLVDDHLVDKLTRKRLSSTLSLDETYDSAMRTLNEYVVNPATPDSEKSATFPSSKTPPEVLPRHSKNRQKENRQTMTAIHEFDWSPHTVVHKSASDSNIVCSSGTDLEVTQPEHQQTLQEKRSPITVCSEHADDAIIDLDLPIKVGTGSNRSTASNRSRVSDRFDYHPSKIYSMPSDEHSITYYQSVGQHQKEKAAGIYAVPNDPALLTATARLCSQSSVVAEDSGDSGIVLNFLPVSTLTQTNRTGGASLENHHQQPTQSQLEQHGEEEENIYTYTTDPTSDLYLHPSPITKRTQGQAPPLAPDTARPPLNDGGHFRSIHVVDIDIGGVDSNNNNNNKGISIADQEFPPPPLQPRSATKDTFDHKPDDYVNSSFIAQSIEKRVEEIRGLSQDRTGVLLKSLNLARYIPMFNSEMINGYLLVELDEQTLRNDISMTHFDARKLFKYVHGWRPAMCYTDDADVNSEPVCWSVNTVVSELSKIKLPLLAKFCRENQIDGSFLVEIVQGEILDNLKTEHEIAMSGIELSRLRAFVLKKWRPDSVPPSAAGDKMRRISQQGRSFSQQNVSSGGVGGSPSNNAPQDRARSNSADKKKTGSLWNRIKAV